jgi:small subunit ribosomal protein S8
MVNDIISDSITRIRNASMRKLEVTNLLHAKIVEALLSVLVEKKYISSFKVVEKGSKKSIKVVLKYDDNDKSVINEITRISKPGRRVYKNAQDLKSFKNGYGTIIVSTNKGVMANDNAFKQNVGGEPLCSIW